jgi:hypothetical protein
LSLQQSVEAGPPLHSEPLKDEEKKSTASEETGLLYRNVHALRYIAMIRTGKEQDRSPR